MDITKEMELSKSELGNVLKTHSDRDTKSLESVKRIASNNPALSDMSVNIELHQNIKLSPGELRNFHDYTRNADTATAFMGKYSLDSTMQYRERFANSQDPLAKHQVQIANDCAYRNMLTAHKAEQLAVDPDKRAVLNKQHAFEKNYVDYREAKVNPEITQKDVMALQGNLQASYKEFKAEKLGYEGIDSSIKNTSPNIKVDQPKVSPTVQAGNQLAKDDVQKRMLAIRTKSQS